MKLAAGTPSAADIAAIQSISTADPVLGLVDVALGRGVMSPTTIYRNRNQDRSGVMGWLHPSGEFHPKVSSTTGRMFVVFDADFEAYEATVLWDGAQKCPTSDTAIGYQDEEELVPLFREHSKGLLLGNYASNGELWNAIALGREMR